MQHNILEIKNLSKNFGGLAAVSDCSISIKKDVYKSLTNTLNSIYKRLDK